MKDHIVLRDGHVHTPFCPHGAADAFELYVEKAIERGIKTISFTEHLPLPLDFMDIETRRINALLHDEVDPYITHVKEIKKQYKGKIEIYVGFEVDYIEGYEEMIKSLLNQYGDLIEDSILSVHFLKVGEKHYPLDDIEGFKELERILGSRSKVYDLYFETLLKSINADLGAYKPKRIGHPTLIRVFQEKYPLEYKNDLLIKQVVDAIKEANYAIDYNHSGLRKPLCKETYPSGKFLECALNQQVNMIYGSDAHSAYDIGR